MAAKIEAVKLENQNWKCQFCTFLNENNEKFCEVCNTNKNRSPSQQLDHPQTQLFIKPLSLRGSQYKNQPVQQTANAIKLETENATTRTVDAEFISINNILSNLNDKTSEHQTNSNNIIDETENCLTKCYSKLNQQLEKINETKLELNKMLSKNKESFYEDEEKQFKKVKKNLRLRFDGLKKAEWLAIGEDMKSKYQKEFNIQWLEKQVLLKKILTNKSEAKIMEVKLSKHFKEFEQQTAHIFKQKVIGMRVVWESNLEKEWLEYLMNYRQKLGKKMKKEWKTKNKNIIMRLSGEVIVKEINEIYGEALDEIHNILQKYQLKQRENLNELKKKFKMQDNMLIDQTVDKSKIKDEAHKNANLEQSTSLKTIEFQKREKPFKDKEHQLQESVTNNEKIKEKEENEWGQDKKKLEKEEEDLRKSLSTWRTKYYEEQNEYLQTIEIFNFNECKLKKDLEKMQKVKQENKVLRSKQSKLKQKIKELKSLVASNQEAPITYWKCQHCTLLNQEEVPVYAYTECSKTNEQIKKKIENQWSCSHCTAINPNHYYICQMCAKKNVNVKAKIENAKGAVSKSKNQLESTPPSPIADDEIGDPFYLTAFNHNLKDASNFISCEEFQKVSDTPIKKTETNENSVLLINNSLETDKYQTTQRISEIQENFSQLINSATTKGGFMSKVENIVSYLTGSKSQKAQKIEKAFKEIIERNSWETLDEEIKKIYRRLVAKGLSDEDINGYHLAILKYIMPEIEDHFVIYMYKENNFKIEATLKELLQVVTMA